MILGAIDIDPEDNSKKIIGSWVYVNSDSFVYTFNENGTGTYLIEESKMKFKYEIKDNKILITYEGETKPFETEFSIKKNVLNIKDSFGKDTLYRRKQRMQMLYILFFVTCYLNLYIVEYK